MKPRHHYAMLAHKLKAGPHGKSKKAKRRESNMDLQTCVDNCVERGRISRRLLRMDE
jgi:hypothetical protein